MKANYVRSYKKRSATNNVANDVFVYTVSGTAEELAEYKKDQADNHRETDEGKSLFFTTRFAGKSVNLVKTRAGQYIADMSELNAAASLAKQYGGNLGTAIAAQAAAGLFGGSTSAPVAVEAPAAEASKLDS